MIEKLPIIYLQSFVTWSIIQQLEVWRLKILGIWSSLEFRDALAFKVMTEKETLLKLQSLINSCSVFLIKEDMIVMWRVGTRCWSTVSRCPWSQCPGWTRSTVWPPWLVSTAWLSTVKLMVYPDQASPGARNNQSELWSRCQNVWNLISSTTYQRLTLLNTLNCTKRRRRGCWLLPLISFPRMSLLLLGTVLIW